MIVSSKIKYLLLSTVFCSFAILPPVAYAQSRTAGTMAGEQNKAVSKQEIQLEGDIGLASAEAQPGPAVSTLPADFELLESYGTLHTVREGALGIDLWDNSRRGSLRDIIADLPSSTPYRTINNLARRVLLTTADARLMSARGSIAPGEDLLTLRLEKLNEMGAFKEAASLYTANPGSPYHERLARAGIIALLHSNQAATACLETLALKDRFSVLPFWRDLLAACTYLINSKTKSATANKVTSENVESPVISKIIESQQFRYAVNSFSDITRLSNLEKAVLIANSRMDYSNFRPADKELLDERTASLLLSDSNLPPNARFGLMRYALARGLRDTDDLAALYRTASFGTLGTDATGWRRLAWLFQTAEATDGSARAPLIRDALAMGESYGPMSLLPFASMMAEIAPDGLTPDALRTAIKTMIYADIAIPPAWQQSWEATRTDSKADSLLTIAYSLHDEFSTFYGGKDFFYENSGLSARETQLIQVLAEKLDIFHNISEDDGARSYEKQTSLTSDDDYVMPSTGLLERLSEAKTDRRLGETVLLGTLALYNAPPGQIHPGLLSEVLDGLKTVGLTEEARDLAAEAILGL